MTANGVTPATDGQPKLSPAIKWQVHAVSARPDPADAAIITHQRHSTRHETESIRMARTPRSPPARYAELFTPEYLARRRRLLEQAQSWDSHDELSPQGPTGHARAIEVSTRLTSLFRAQVREHCMDITPQEVIDVLVSAKVKNWVLMGLHGYAGYLPEPRATQDVDVMVPKRERKKAVNAVHAAWPTLEVAEYPEVVRFKDPNDLDSDGRAKPVIDIMLPLAAFQQTILKEFVFIDPKTRHRLPRVEAALVGKYAPMVSLTRTQERKGYDASDFRRIVKANHEAIDRNKLHGLADEVYPGGGDEILTFLDLAMTDEPFPL